MSVFLNLEESQILFRGKHFFLIFDKFPVSAGHILIISNHLRSDFFALTSDEKEDLSRMIDKAKLIIEESHAPDGYNIGMNCGEPAGQTVFHFHCHIIPRYVGDMENPRGGVRHCVAGKGDY